ncbi:MAG: ZIP family metal transporter [Thermoanaerobaculaceae bacterium]
MFIYGLALLLLVAAATLAGGIAPLRFRQQDRLFLAFSAGTLVGLALGELIPEGLIATKDPHLALTVVLLTFLATMAADKLHILHPHPHRMDECCPPVEHRHAPLALPGAFGLLLHSALDGVALAAALQQSASTAAALSLALAAHKFGDGLTAVSLVLSHHHPPRQAVYVLLGNAALLAAGFSVALVVAFPENMVSWFLLALAGFFLYLGASDLIPSLTTVACRKRDVVATALGAVMVMAVALLAH